MVKTDTLKEDSKIADVVNKTIDKMGDALYINRTSSDYLGRNDRRSSYLDALGKATPAEIKRLFTEILNERSIVV